MGSKEDCFNHIELGTIETFDALHKFSINSQSSKGYTFLSFAVRKGSIKSVSYILRRGANVNYRETGGMTPLMLAIYFGRYDVVQLLVRYGANVKDRDSYETPLTLAVRQNHLDIVKFLVENGADVEDTNIEGFSPLFCSIKDNKRLDILDFFLEKKVGKGTVDTAKNTPLIAAIRNNCSLDIIRCFLKYKTDLNESQNEKTPLAWASRIGNLELVEILLSNGADINLVSEDGNTALATAVHCKQNEVVKYLLSRSCNICKVGKKGKTPLLWAVLNEDINITKILLKHGADYTIDTVFCAAIKTNNLDIVKLLYETEKLITLPDEGTYVYEAVCWGNVEIARYLITQYLSTHEGIVGLLGLGIVLTTLEDKQFEMVKLLIESGIELNFTCFEQTPLTVVVEMGNFEMVKYFVSQGADVNQADEKATPLEIALANDDLQIFQYLVDSGATISKEDETENPKLAKYYKIAKTKNIKREICSNQEGSDSDISCI